MLRCAVCLLACLLAYPGPAEPQVLEAVTAVDDTSRMDIGPRVFKRAVIDSLREARVFVDSLGAVPPKIWILEGGSFEFGHLYLRAADANGKTVHGAPVRFELKSMIATFGIDRIMGYQAGQARMTITSVLPRRDGKSTAQTYVEIEVYSR